ncbi:hypothetical protein CEXT_337061, partial [Caerostris extrusa]
KAFKESYKGEEEKRRLKGSSSSIQKSMQILLRGLSKDSINLRAVSPLRYKSERKTWVLGPKKGTDPPAPARHKCTFFMDGKGRAAA